MKFEAVAESYVRAAYPTRVFIMIDKDQLDDLTEVFVFEDFASEQKLTVTIMNGSIEGVLH